jgi:hypothetical protein
MNALVRSWHLLLISVAAGCAASTEDRPDTAVTETVTKASELEWVQADVSTASVAIGATIHPIPDLGDEELGNEAKPPVNPIPDDDR